MNKVDVYLITMVILLWLSVFYNEGVFGQPMREDGNGQGVLTSSGSYTISNVITPSGSDLLLVVGITTDGGADVTSITWGGVTLDAQVEELDSSGKPNVEIHTFTGPSGTNDIVINVASDDKISYFYSFYSDVDQTIPVDSTAQNSGKASGGSQPSLSVTSESGDTVFDLLASVGDSIMDEDVSQTEPISPLEMGGSGQSGHYSASSYEDSISTSTIMSWTNIQNGKEFSHVAINIQAAQIPQTFSITLTDSIGITDSVSITAHYKRTLSDSISIGDSVSVVHTSAPVVYEITLTDSIGISDSVSVVHIVAPIIYQINLSDSISISDSVSVVLIPAVPGPQHFKITLTDSIGISDSVTINGEVIIPPEPEPEVVRKRGGDDNEHKTRPTFGIDHNIDGKQIVDSGFIINNKRVTITNNFHTEIPVIELKVGELNVLSAKAFSPRGLKEVEFIFGIPEVGKHHEAEAAVEIWLDNRTPSIVINQEDNFIRGNVTALKTEAKCNPRDQTMCENVSIFITFNEAPLNSVFAIQAIDLAGRYIITSINDGVLVTGDSLNPPNTEYMAQGKKGLVLLTQTDKRNNLWTDAEGIEYTKNRADTWIRLTPWPMPNPVDNWKVEDRYISYWHEKVLYEQAKAKYVFNSEAIQN